MRPLLREKVEWSICFKNMHYLFQKPFHFFVPAAVSKIWTATPPSIYKWNPPPVSPPGSIHPPSQSLLPSVLLLLLPCAPQGAAMGAPIAPSRCKGFHRPVCPSAHHRRTPQALLIRFCNESGPILGLLGTENLHFWVHFPQKTPLSSTHRVQ